MMKRLAFGLFLLLLVGVLGLWLSWSQLTNILRQRLETAIAGALQMQTRIDALTVSLVPLRVHVGGVLIGTESAPFVKLGSGDVRFFPLASYAEWRPVVTIGVHAALFDASQLPKPEPPPGAQGPEPEAFEVFPFRIRSFDLTDARVRFDLGDKLATVSVRHASGRLGSTLDHRIAALLDASGLEFEHQGHLVQLAAAQLDGGFGAHGLYVTSLRVKGDELNAALTAGKRTRQYRLSATLNLKAVEALVGQAVGGEAVIDGTLSGDLIDPALNVHLAVKGLLAAGRAIGNLNVQVARQGARVHLTTLEITGPIGALSGKVDIVTAGKTPVDGTVHLEKVDLDTLLSAVGKPLDMGSLVSGTASVSGTLDPLSIDIKAMGAFEKTPKPVQPQSAGAGAGHNTTRLPSATANPPPPSEDPPATPTPMESGGTTKEQSQTSVPGAASFNLRAHVGVGGPQIQLEVTQPEGNRLTAEIRSQNSQLRGPVNLHVRDLAALMKFMPKSVRDLGLTGTVEGAVTLSGSMDRPTLKASVNGRDVTLMGTTIPELTAALTVTGSALTVQNLTVTTATGGLHLAGTVALNDATRNDWQLQIQGLETDFVMAIIHPFIGVSLPLSGGRLEGSVQAQGLWAKLTAHGDVTESGVSLYGEPIERITVSAVAHLPQWQMHVAVVHTGKETLTVEGTGTGTAGIELAIASTPIELASFRGAGRGQESGTVTVHGRISGNPSMPDGSIEVVGTDLAIGNRRIGNLTLRADGTRGDWKLVVSAFADALRLDATVRTSARYPYTLAVRAREVQLGPVISSDASLRATISAAIDLRGQLTAWDKPTGKVEVAEFQAQRDQYTVQAAKPIRIDVQDGVFRIRSFVLTARGSQLTLTGQATLSGGMDVQAQGEGDLVLLELIGRPFNSTRGEFAVTVRVRRQPGEPWDLSGHAQVRGATFDLGLPVAFTDVNGNFSLAAGNVRIDTLAGKAGGGQFEANGVLGLESGPALSWKIRQVAMSTGEGLEARVSGTGRVHGTWKMITVSGDVEVLDALYDRDVELVELLPFFREQIQPAPRTKPPSTVIRLDLHVHAPGGLYVDNNVAKVEMGADLHIEGVTDKPELLGNIDILTGTVTFRKRTFEITSGSIDFRDRFTINPALNISAQSEISTVDADYTVIVSVSGNADNPRVELSADDPSLSQTDILSLITFGKTTAQMQREGGGVSALDALALLPTGAATEGLGHLIGVDRFQVEAVQSRNTGTIEPRVTIGKDLTDRFNASVSSSFGVEAERSVQLEYRLTRRLSLLGSWEAQTQSQAGAFGGDVKFRYEFRKLPFSLLLPGGLKSTAPGHAQ